MARAKKPKHYLNNANMLEQVLESKQTQLDHPDWTPTKCLTPLLVEMFTKLVYRYSQKPNWRGYSWIDDMRSEALMVLCTNALKFNEEKSSNCFGYFTQFVKNSFLSYIDKEKVQRNVKDAILINHGFAPSFANQVGSSTYDEGSWDDNHN